MNEVQVKIKKSSRAICVITICVLAFYVYLAGVQVFEFFSTGREFITSSFITTNSIFVLMQVVNASIAYLVFKMFYDIGNDYTPFDNRVVVKLRWIGILFIIHNLLMILSDFIVAIAYSEGGNAMFSLLGFSYAGVATGVVILFISMIFSYGCQLQQQSDETL